MAVLDVGKRKPSMASPDISHHQFHYRPAAASIAKLEALGYEPTVPLEQGLAHTLYWYKHAVERRVAA